MLYTPGCVAKSLFSTDVFYFMKSTQKFVILGPILILTSNNILYNVFPD